MVSRTENKKITEVVLVHYNIANNSESCINYKKKIGQLLDNSPKQNHIFKDNWFRFSFTEVWFTGQNSKQLEIEDKTSITLMHNILKNDLLINGT